MKDENSPLHEKQKTILEAQRQAESVLDISTLPEKKSNDDMNTNMLDEQWASLSQDWQEQPYEKTDIKALAKRTSRRTFWAKTYFILNIITTVSFFAAFVYGIFMGEFGSAWNTYLGGGGLISLVFIYYEADIRMKTWRKMSDSPDQAIDNAIAEVQSSMKYMLLIKWSSIPFGVLVNWFVFSFKMEQEKSPIVGLAYANGIIIIMYIWAEIIQRKRKKEYSTLLANKENNKL